MWLKKEENMNSSKIILLVKYNFHDYLKYIIVLCKCSLKYLDTYYDMIRKMFKLDLCDVIRPLTCSVSFVNIIALFRLSPAPTPTKSSGLICKRNFFQKRTRPTRMHTSILLI